MINRNYLFMLTIILGIGLVSCKQGSDQNSSTVQEESMMPSMEEYYSKTKSSVNSEDGSEFDSTPEGVDTYNPTSPEASELLYKRGRVFEMDSTMEVRFDDRSTEELNGKEPMDTLRIGKESFTRNLHNITENDLYNLRHNLEFVKETKENAATDGDCSGKDCPVYAHINKKEQRLYLYLNGNIVDTFKTSTARSGYKTPDFDKKPDGRIFTKYSSHKYPGGSWNGLGNMPYAVFISGGYAIHGATSGEIHQLGNPASHGCIRLHPKNAKIFNNLVKFAGAENTWVHVTED